MSWCGISFTTTPIIYLALNYITSTCTILIKCQTLVFILMYIDFSKPHNPHRLPHFTHYETKVRKEKCPAKSQAVMHVTTRVQTQAFRVCAADQIWKHSNETWSPIILHSKTFPIPFLPDSGPWPWRMILDRTVSTEQDLAEQMQKRCQKWQRVKAQTSE
jgi:hypothetical protein